MFDPGEFERPKFDCIKALGLMVSDKKIFSCFSLKACVKYVTLGAGPFRPKGHNSNKIGRGPQGDATYQISRF